MNTAAIRKVEKIRKNNAKRNMIAAIRTKRTISGLYGFNADLSTEHLREGFIFGSEAFYKRNTSKEYAYRTGKQTSTPFSVVPDSMEETQEAPLTALVGKSADFSFLAENDRMDMSEVIPEKQEADNTDGLEALEDLDPVAVEAE